jgi:hypothetical protein
MTGISEVGARDVGTNSINWAQIFYVRTQTESSIQEFALNNNKTTDNT